MCNYESELKNSRSSTRRLRTRYDVVGIATVDESIRSLFLSLSLEYVEERCEEKKKENKKKSARPASFLAPFARERTSGPGALGARGAVKREKSTGGREKEIYIHICGSRNNNIIFAREKKKKERARAHT